MLVNLKRFVDESIKKYPHLKEEINELFQLCMDEIEEGNSQSNEVYLCESSINDLINNQ